MPPPVPNTLPSNTLVDQDGVAHAVPDKDTASLLAQGWRFQTPEDINKASTEAALEQDYGGVGGTAKAIAYGVPRGLTLGLSDVVARAAGKPAQELSLLSQQNQIASIGSELVGNIAPALVSGGAALAKTPAGLIAGVGRSAIESAAERGVLGRAGAAATGAAIEGAVVGGGQYLSQVALEDKPLSAEGFVGAMGHGALFAAPIGGALSLGESALIRARKLFPGEQVSALRAAGVKQEAAQALTTAATDGETMAVAARQKLALTEAKIGLAEAGEQQTRRVFGTAAPESIGDQITGGVERQQLQTALREYEASKVQLDDWLRAEADPDLEAALLGVRAPDVGAPGGRIEKLPGKFGEPELAAGTPVNRDLNDALDMRARQLDTTAVGKKPAVPVELIEGVGTAAGKRPAAAVGALESQLAGTKAQLDAGATLGEVAAGSPLRKAYVTGKELDSGMPLTQGPETNQPFGMSGVPTYESIKAHSDKFDDYFEQTLPAKAIAERGYYEPVGGHADAVRIAKAKKAIAEGQREAIYLNVTPTGKVTVTGGRHRLAAAIEAGKPIKVKWSTGFEPAGDDVLREGPSPAAPGPRYRITAAADQESPLARDSYMPVLKKGAKGSPTQLDSTVMIRNPDKPHGTVWSEFPIPLPEGVRVDLGKVEAARRSMLDAIEGSADRFPNAINYDEQAALRKGSFDIAEAYGMHPRNRNAPHSNRMEIQGPNTPEYLRMPEGAAATQHGEGSDYHGMMVVDSDIADGYARFLARRPEEWRAIGAASEAGDMEAVRSLGSAHVINHETVHAHGPLLDWRGPMSPSIEELTTELSARRISADSFGVSSIDQLSLNGYHQIINPVIDAVANAAGVTRSTSQRALEVASLRFKRLSGSINEKKAVDFIANDVASTLRISSGKKWTIIEALEESFSPDAVKLALKDAAGAPKFSDDLDRLSEWSAKEPTWAGRPSASPKGPGGDDSLTGLLRGTKQQLDEGVPFRDVSPGRPVVASNQNNIGSDILRHEFGTPQVTRALGKRVGNNVDMGPDLTRAAKAIGDHEAATAQLAEALGGTAPVTAVENAKAYRAAVVAQQDTFAASTAKTAGDITNKLQPQLATRTLFGGETVVDDQIAKALQAHDMKAAGRPSLADGTIPKPPATAAPSSALGKLADIGTALEVLQAMGVHVPDISKIPVIGPVLSLYLKARAVLGILGRKGGSIGRGTESVIAAKSAATRDRIAAATAAILETGARGAKKASAFAAGPAVLLGIKLFPGGDDPKSKDPRVLYEARMDEIARALSPGAIAAAVGDRVQTSDPILQDAIISQVERGMRFLDSKAPKQTVLPGMLPGDGKWKPSRASLEVFGRYVKAVNDPASVLEDLAKGHVTIEGAETLRVVYPKLYAEAQRLLLEAAPKLQKTLSYSRRVAISIMYQVPVDGTMTPEHLQFLRPATEPVNMPGGVQNTPPGAPAITGPLQIGQQTMTALDRRAGM